MNAIEIAVMPLKTIAVERAEKEVKTLIERYTQALIEAGMDLDVVAPYPKANKCSRNEYLSGMAKRSTYQMFVKSTRGSRRHGEPTIVEVCPEYVERFIRNTKEDASADYDSFVAKLVLKIGEVSDAKLTGDHVWSFSILTVVKLDGTKENWKTQMIVNVSKLGKLFNQFPTRKVK